MQDTASSTAQTRIAHPPQRRWDEPSTFRTALRRWFAEQGELPVLVGRSELDLPTVLAWQRRIYEAGWAGLTWPVEYGGQGLGFEYQAVYNEELVRARGPIPPGQPGIDVVGPTIVRYGSAEQCRSLLPPLLAGLDLWCLGLSEPESGSDLASLRTHATRTADGSTYLLRGQKIWTSYGPSATHCLVLARTDRDAGKHAGLSLFLAPLDLPGITIRPILDMSGDRHFSEVFFDDAPVPADALLGECNRGWEYTRESLSMERGPMMTRRLAELSMALDQFEAGLRGQPVTDAELAGIGRTRAQLDALRGQAQRLHRRMSAERGASPLDSVDKLFFARVDREMFELVSAMLGPYRTVSDATTRGIDADRWTRRYFYSRMGSIYGGTDQVQRDIVARQLLGLPRA